MTLRPLVAALAASALMIATGCNSAPKTEETAAPAADTAATKLTAKAELKDKDGTTIGTANFEEADGGVNIMIDAKGLTPGEHGFHIHETGVCEAPAFTSAGGHFNPTAMQHGKDMEGGPHVGDLLNLTADATGEGQTKRMIDGATLGEGANSIMGKAVVIHADPDDYKSQPSGAAGARVACGVIGQ